MKSQWGLRVLMGVKALILAWAREGVKEREVLS